MSAPEVPVEKAESDSGAASVAAFVRRFARHKMAVLGLVVLVGLAVASFGATWIAPAPQGAQDLGLGPTAPSAAHWFGTDELGRDYLSEILYAGRVSLAVGLGVSVLSTTIGTLIGTMAGYIGGWVDEMVMRLTDLFLIVPAIAILALGLEALGQSTITIMAVLAAVAWTPIARIARSQVLSLREKEFVDAARAIGASTPRIVVRHILPNLAGVIAVNMSLAVAVAVIIESTLSFLGFGVQPPDSSWGSLLSTAAGLVGTPQAYLLYFPGLLILLTVLAVNFVGDGLRDALDPQSKQL